MGYLEKRQLGQSDIFVSTIGLGTVKLGRNQGVKYPTAFDLPSDKEIDTLLAVAKENGVNLLDTAPAYGLSEARLGKALKNHYRHDWLISSKVGEEFENGESFFNYSEAHIQFSIERSLKRLNTDFLDIVLVHSDGNDLKIIDDGALEILKDIKKRGLIRAFGMSTKTVEGGIKALEQSDVAMIMHNPIYQQEQAVIDFATKAKKGIFVKKAYASGHLQKLNCQNPIDSATRFVLETKGVTSLITGTSNPKHLQQSINSAIKF